MYCRFASARQGKREGRALRRRSGGGPGARRERHVRAGKTRDRRPGNGDEALLDGKSRRAGRVRKGGRRAAFSQGSAGISCRRKAETTWPASCSRASLFDIVELSTYCEARCTTTGLSLFRELVSGGSAVFTMSRQKKTALPANRTTRSRGRGLSPENTKPRTRTIRGLEPEHSKREGLERVHLEKITAE